MVCCLRSFVVGCLLFVVGWFLSLDVLFLFLVSRCWMSVVFDVCCSLFNVRCLLFVLCCA